MKRWNVVLLLACMAICALLLSGCGSKTPEKQVSMYDLQQAMVEADPSFPDMTTVNSSSEDAQDLFTYISDLDYTKVSGYCLAYSSEGLADEVAVIELISGEDREEAVESLKEHASDRVKLYQNYDKSQLKRAEDAMIFGKDNYAVLIISDHAQEVRAAFLDFINE